MNEVFPRRSTPRPCFSANNAENFLVLTNTHDGESHGRPSCEVFRGANSEECEKRRSFLPTGPARVS